MKIDLGKLNMMILDKYISVQKHPTLDLFIYNYTQKCQFNRMWTDETLMCRGLILDIVGNIVARPFSKFFNYEEHVGEDSKLPALPLEEFEVFDKLDGSLGILYSDNGRPTLATRGSFVSDQAIRGTQILNSKYECGFDLDKFTYLFEIIYPENRIVVDYKGESKLVLLAVINTQTGEELPYTALEMIADAKGLDLVERFDYSDLSKVRELQMENAEGFVIKFKSGMRVKMKFQEYVRLHRLVTGVNAKRIWESLKDGKPIDELLERVPDEFYKWVSKTVKDLQEEYDLAESVATKHWEIIKTLPTRKDQAMKLKELDFPKAALIQSVVFSMLDKKPYDQIIWKFLRPAADKPFKEDIDA